jgi:hypothetical protein
VVVYHKPRKGGILQPQSLSKEAPVVLVPYVRRELVGRDPELCARNPNDVSPYPAHSLYYMCGTNTVT